MDVIFVTFVDPVSHRLRDVLDKGSGSIDAVDAAKTVTY
jgi:hypothetical protein